MTNLDPWTEHEVDYLTKNWVECGLKVMEVLDRSEIAIRSKARELGLRRATTAQPWSKADVELLTVVWQKYGPDCVKLFPARTSYGVQSKAHAMGLLMTGAKRVKQKSLSDGYGSLPEGRVSSVWELGESL